MKAAAKELQKQAERKIRDLQYLVKVSPVWTSEAAKRIAGIRAMLDKLNREG